MSLWRHLKRGSLYNVLTHGAQLQCSTHPEIEKLFEGKRFTIYTSTDNGQAYIRLSDEFTDGRFELQRLSHR